MKIPSITLILSCLTAQTLCGQSVLINELMVENLTIEDHFREYTPWVEIINAQNDSLSLADYYLSTDTLNADSYELPEVMVGPGSTSVIYFSTTDNIVENSVYINFQLSPASPYLALVNQKVGTVEDVVEQGDFSKKNQSLGRFPNGSSSRYYFKDHLLTPGRENPHPGPWKKIATNARFSPRDSSPNASTIHNDSVWVFAGYRYENGTWDSRSDVWKSGDGIKWELVNDAPPYYPYCAFVSFQNRIWAFGGVSYSSVDGVQWNEVQTNVYLGYAIKVVQFENKLIAINGRTILSSADGINWEVLTTEAPWPARNWPGLVEMNHRLYFLGGGSDYFTGQDYYYKDVWVSDDGVSWDLLTDVAPFQDAYWVCYQSFDGRLWAMGGWNYYQLENEFGGNNNEIWVSEDGVDWEKLEVSPVWSPRHAMFTYVFKNALHVSSGYGSQGLETLYNDVWQFSRSVQEIYPDSIMVTYGDPPFAVRASSGLPVRLQTENAGVVGANGSEVNFLAAGQAKILATQEGNTLYFPAQSYITVSIKKKGIIVKPADHIIEFGEPYPMVNVTYDGFVGQDNISDLDEEPTVLLPSAFSTAGEYNITLEGGTDDNYEYLLANGKLTIKRGKNQFYLYPNPAADFINVIGQNDPEDSWTFVLIDMHGKVLLSSNLMHGRNFYTIDLTSFHSGIYLYKISGGNISTMGRIVLHK